MQAAAVPVGMSWMWTLAFGHHEDRTSADGCRNARGRDGERSRATTPQRI